MVYEYKDCCWYECVDYPPSLDKLYGRSESR